MSHTEYPAPVSYRDYRNGRGMSWLSAAALIAGGSALIWGLVLYAVWLLI